MFVKGQKTKAPPPPTKTDGSKSYLDKYMKKKKISKEAC